MTETYSDMFFRFLAMGAYNNTSLCTECYYKPGSCGQVHQGTPIPAPPPSMLTGLTPSTTPSPTSTPTSLPPPTQV